jgi:hypothetical protein
MKPYSADAHEAAVERLNAKLSAAGSEWRFPAEERPGGADVLPVWTESFVAMGDDEVFGGYVLKHQRFLVHGDSCDVGSLQMPLSLGHLDSAYSNVSVALLFDVMRRSPLAYSLGLGSEATDFARLLTAGGWRHLPVPFYFSVKSANTFARNVRLPAGKERAQKLLRTLGRTRLAAPAFRARQLMKSPRRPRAGDRALDRVREVDAFGPLADDLFAAHANAYSFVGDRGAEALEYLYADDADRYIRIVVEKNGAPLGWCLLLDTAMRDDKYFGDLRVGSLVDCFAAPDDAVAVVAAADDFLTRRGVDLVLSNQLHVSWCGALEAAGYQQGPSNMFFYYSKDLGSRLATGDDWHRGAHLNRGDGEGPTNL